MSTKPKAKSPRIEPAAQAVLTDRVTPFLTRYSGLLAIVLAVIASLRIVSTYTVFMHTSDEPAHIACGMEWLDKGTYTWEPQHPPLARIATALGPYMAGLRSLATQRGADLRMFQEGAKILYEQDKYDRNLALARLGILPFFWVGCLAIYIWGKRYFNRAVAVLAVFVFSFIPSILAHASLATTDMALTAFMAAAFVAGLIWVEEPTLKHTLWFGAMSGLMVLSKFSCLVFFPVVVVMALVAYFVKERPGLQATLQEAKRRLPLFGLAVLVGFVLIWAGYRFSFGKVPTLGISAPFPELFDGIHAVQEHADRGHRSYLLGETSEKGFWDFYLVGIAVKNPIGFLILLAIGMLLIFRKSPFTRNLWMPTVFWAGTLLVGMFSTINIGTRHVLPVYAGFSLIAAVAIAQLLESGSTARWKWGLGGALVLWFALSSGLSHPDYLAYFNELAGSEPENILVDSDLDWGQDVKRLAARLKEVKADKVAYTSYVWAELEEHHGFPKITPTGRFRPNPGWNAIGVTLLKAYRPIFWPDEIKPHWRIGKGIYLWYFPPGSSVTGAAPGNQPGH